MSIPVWKGQCTRGHFMYSVWHLHKFHSEFHAIIEHCSTCYTWVYILSTRLIYVWRNQQVHRNYMYCTLTVCCKPMCPLIGSPWWALHLSPQCSGYYVCADKWSICLTGLNTCKSGIGENVLFKAALSDWPSNGYVFLARFSQYIWYLTFTLVAFWRDGTSEGDKSVQCFISGFLYIQDNKVWSAFYTN